MHELELSDDEIELVKKFESREPTLKDIKNRKISLEQFTELCTRLKCCVKMNRWNPVADYKKRLMREGRLQNKSPRKQLKLLAKAVNRHKETAVYSDEHIAYVRRELWLEQMKDNLMLLDLWEYDRKVADEKARDDEESTVDVGTQHISMDDTQSLDDGGESVNQSDSEYNQELLKEFEMVNTESFSVSLLGSELLGDDFNSQPVLTEEFDSHVPLTSTQKSQEPD